MFAARLGLVDHGCESRCLCLEDLDLAVDPHARIGEKRAALGWIAGLPQALAISFACRVVLEQLADLGQRETSVVAQASNEQQALEVRLVVQPVVTVGPGGRFQQPDFLVVADSPRGQAGLGGHLVDAQEPRFGRVGHRPNDSPTLTFT